MADPDIKLPPGFKLVEQSDPVIKPPPGFRLVEGGGSAQNPPPTPNTESDGAFFGLAGALPESAQRFVPGFLKGPTVGEQLSAEGQRTTAEEQRLGRSLTLAERNRLNPATGSPVAMGFATHPVGELPGAMAGAAQAAGEKFIKDQYTRAVKPTVTGKSTAGQRDIYEAKARDAISSIVENKPNLQFTDDAGNVRQGELPKTLEEFGDAVAQTKQGIFAKYDALAQQTQAAGVDVTLMPAVRELQTIAGDQVVNLMHPELAKYAQERADTFSRTGQLSATDAQRAVTMLNQSLKAFYRNPSSPEIAARAQIDAMVANNLRSSLDQAVENAVGPGYQELKNQYGALSTIEKEVNNRAQIVGRQEKGGGIFGRLTDALSAADVIHGVLSLNPARIASGIGMKAVGEHVKYLRSPNRAVTRLFEKAENQQTPVSRPIVPSMPISPIFPSRREPWKEVVPDAR